MKKIYDLPNINKGCFEQGGILLGPSALGRSKAFLDNVFPTQSLTVLDTLANIGLLFFLFLVGLELDLRAIGRTGKRALAIALAGISLPFALGVGTSVVLRSTVAKGARQGPFLVFMGVALSITAFPVLARILAELKLLTTNIGQIAMSAAAINDVAAWILLALAIALSGSGSALISLWVLLCGLAFVGGVAIFVRPILDWMVRHSPQGEPVKEMYICATLTTVLAAGFVTDTIGIHALFGAFVVGIFVPKEGPFAGVLIEKIEDMITGLFLPLYFVSSGLKTNVATISGAQSWGLLVLVITTACLGFLMNTKGLVELIVLNIGKDRKVLNDETFAILVLMALFTTFITTPIVMAIYKPARRPTPYKHRTIERVEADSELRVLACFYSSHSIPTLINIMESSRGTCRRGVIVYAMHLVELSERSSAISMVHRARRNGLPFWNRSTAPSEQGDHVVVAFEAYQQLSHVSIRPMTAISDLHTIHEDILESAQQKRVAFIILPFHKILQVDGSLQSLNHIYQQINRRILSQAPCSVGILVDRGLGGTAQVSASSVSYTIIVFFFGGADDREALVYGARMAEHPGISLRLVRFLLSAGPDSSSTITIHEGELSADEAAISKVRESNTEVQFQEREARTSSEIISVIKEVGKGNLLLVGRRSPPMTTLIEKPSDVCSELGPVGSYLASSDFTYATSVMVIQQYNPHSHPTPIQSEEPENQEQMTCSILVDAPSTQQAAKATVMPVD
ncbi:Cation/H+ exchanger domain-containing protein [Dioscorea alata]|uniref:Cation/H+ exchanger domain-containing protein n=1 Tax=Dioscorea alata TaxID=55571 RepID=A0ACB7U4U9_DIOAL|nr:Cation/H+ exchanger domain-containing protein [Dioscorea alata]